MKYTSKAIVLRYLSQFFQTVVRWKKRCRLYQRYMAKIRKSVMKLYT